MTVATAAVFLFCSSVSFSSEMIKVKDMNGRIVSVPANPSRIIGLSASIVEIVYDLGKGNLLVGAVSYSDFPEEAKRLPRVGSYSKPDLEKIISLKPDLCIAMKDGNPEESVKRMDSLGIPVFAVDTASLSGIYQGISAIGDLLDRKMEAEGLIVAMRSKISAVEKRVSSFKERPGVVFEVNEEPLILAGKNTFIDEMIKTAGGVNLVSQGVDYPRLTKEKAVSMMPEIIIISGMTEETRKKTWWSEFKDIPAVKNRKIHRVSPDIFLRPTPRIADCIQKLSWIIHPDNNQPE